MKEIEFNSQTPEQLVRLLETQLAAQRARRKKPERNRVAFLVSSVLIIMAAAAIALMVLEQMLIDSPRGGDRAAPSGTISGTKY